ncbi:exosortase A [Rhodoferax sp.]|uniref:exosortase A n=1 Tax=Rhodoferax sp. TaxID=50421 RepID=UPI0025FF3861|nr:exosortase A [Rhodoferax sp.]
MNMPDAVKKHWLNAIFAFSALFFWVIFLFWNTFYGMVAIWARSETFTHGFLVIPIVIWLIWLKRNVLASELPKTNFWILIPIFFTSIVWLLGNLVSINSVTQLAAVAIVVLLVLSIFGWSITSIIIFPLLFLFFAVPLGEFLLPLLMDWTAKFTVIAVRLSGVPVYQEGLQFVISSGSWSVVEACSGVRYLISSIMIGTLYAYLNYQSLNRRVIFVCVSIVVPVFANWMRAYFIVMLGHISGNKLAVGFDHLIYGWLFFGVVIMLMFLIGGRWAESTNFEEEKLNSVYTDAQFKNSSFWCMALIISCLVALPVGWENFVVYNQGPESPVMAAPSVLKSGWTRSNDGYIDIKPKFHGSAVDLNNIYIKNFVHAGFYVKYYRNQNYINKLVNSENSIFNTKDKYWILSRSENYIVKGLDDALTVRATDWKGLGVPGQIGETHLQTWQFYWVNGVFTGNDYIAKAYGAIQRLWGNGDDSAVIVLYAKDDVNHLAKKSIEEFLRDNYSEIKIILEKTRSE